MRVDVDLRGLDRVQFVVRRRPYQSIALQLKYALRWTPGRLPAAWRRRILSAVDRRLGPRLGALKYLVPRQISESGQGSDGPPGRIEDGRDASGDDLAAWVANGFGPTPPEPLRQVQDHPRAFLAAAASAAEQSSGLTRSLWSTVGPLFDLEERRISSVTSAVAKRELLATLSPVLRPSGDRLIGPDVGPRTEERLLPLADRVELVPVLAGPNAALMSINPEFDRITQIAYVLPLLDRLLAGRPIEPEPVPLELLLGAVRARVLQTLDRPLTVSDLAELISAAMSKITYHCDHLQAVGLVRRHRSGNRVWIERTERGDQLVQIMT